MSAASYPHIFQPGQIGTLKLKNRIIFSPCESHFATTEGEVTQRLIDYFVRRAEGGASMLVVHSAQACTKVDPNDTFAGSLRVDDNAHLPMLSELTEAVHRAGAKIAILVSTGGGASAMGAPPVPALCAISVPGRTGRPTLGTGRRSPRRPPGRCDKMTHPRAVRPPRRLEGPRRPSVAQPGMAR